ncbi:MAG: MucR family transcriptional regulator [Methylobacterium radiotolerans]
MAAFVSRQAVAAADLPGLMRTVRDGLLALGDVGPPIVAEPEPDRPAPTPAQIRKSVHPDRLISFINGCEYRTLKRHLTAYGLTPDSYRARFSQPHDYPMVVAGYAAKHSALAKAIGLGVHGAQAACRRAAASSTTPSTYTGREMPFWDAQSFRIDKRG